MTNKEKKTLSNAILGYLPYKLKVRYYDMEDGREEDGYIDGVVFDASEPEFYVDQYAIKAESLKPYLRPMSSMMEEEKEEFYGTMSKYTHRLYPNSCDWSEHTEYSWTIVTFDWLNTHHFDYHGLISMGLALPATEEMYND